jgi:hypothetical protein
MHCNERLHQSKDPITEHMKGALHKTFLPYHRPGLQHIDVTFDLPAANSVKVIAQDLDSTDRVANFDRLYSVSDQWSQALRTIHHTLITGLAVRFKSTGYTDDDLVRELEFKSTSAQHNALIVPNSFLEFKYILWCHQHRELITPELDEMLLYQ